MKPREAGRRLLTVATTNQIRFAIALLCFVFTVRAQSGNPLKQQLEARLTLTKLTPGGDGIASQGATLVLQKNGLWMYAVSSPQPPLNAYKNGKLSKSVSRDFAITMGIKGNNGLINLPKRTFNARETCSIIGTGIEKDGIVLRLLSDEYDGMRYYGDLKFAFEKNAIPTIDQAVALISEVLVVRPDVAPAPRAEIADQEPTKPPATVAASKLPAMYTSTQNSADQLQLNADKSFSLLAGGQTYHGTFALNGNTLEFDITETKDKTTATVDGDKITDNSGQTWVLRNQSASGALPTEEALKNQDVIDLAKAGLDDATILAKIVNSKCQFDTSPNALIQLKKTGVSAAIIKAMVGAGK